jgi:hypothetical protein
MHYLLQNQEGHEGHDGGEQGAAQPAEPAGNIAPADDEADQQEPTVPTPPLTRKQKGGIATKGRGGTMHHFNAEQANVEARGAARAGFASAQARLAQLCC